MTRFGVIALVFICLALTVFSSCGSDDAALNAVARVNDQYLSKSELRRAIPFGLSKEDSTQFANEYITQWLKHKVVLKRAENNLLDEQKDVSKQLEDYRASLITFAYEQELVKQKLDTIVADSAIENYYNLHPGNFELRSNIIRLRYIKVPVNTPNVDKAKKWFVSSDDKELEKLEQFANLYAVNYLLDDQNWLLLDDVVKEVPLTESSIGTMSASKKMIEIKDKEYHYLVAVSGFKVKDSQAPLSFERATIKNIILNKRKIRLIEKMQEDAYNDALNEKQIEIYTK